MLDKRGYPSKDLKADALRAGVFEFIEKPFELTNIRSAVQKAMARKMQEDQRAEPVCPIGIVLVAESGDIIHANRKATELFTVTEAGISPKSLVDLFAERELATLEAATWHWVNVFPIAPELVSWHVRVKRWPGGQDRMLGLLADDQKRYMDHRIVEMLFGADE